MFTTSLWPLISWNILIVLSPPENEPLFYVSFSCYSPWIDNDHFFCPFFSQYQSRTLNFVFGEGTRAKLRSQKQNVHSRNWKIMDGLRRNRHSSFGSVVFLLMKPVLDILNLNVKGFWLLLQFIGYLGNLHKSIWSDFKTGWG